MEPAKTQHLSLNEYNLLEEENNLRYEYHDGEVFAMAGGDPKHGAIASNVNRLLGNALLSKDCTVLTSDVKFHISSVNKSLYPDVSVVCGKAKRSEKDIRALMNPILLVEVLSESTSTYDKGEKFRYYSELSSLREYVLIEQDTRTVEVRYRSAANAIWQLEWATDQEGQILLKSIDFTLSLEEVYRRTEEL